MRLLKLLTSIAVCQFAGVIGSIFTYSSVNTWYVELQKPFFTPPDWVFAPVWMVLYTLMGVSAFLVWKRGWNGKKVRAALEVFLLQLFLNSLWSFVFFGLRAPVLAMYVILVMWMAILWAMIKFREISRAAWLMLMPYLLWVGYAVLLNVGIVVLNK